MVAGTRYSCLMGVKHGRLYPKLADCMEIWLSTWWVRWDEEWVLGAVHLMLVGVAAIQLGGRLKNVGKR